jgi:hypothetical protein
LGAVELGGGSVDFMGESAAIAAGEVVGAVKHDQFRDAFLLGKGEGELLFGIVALAQAGLQRAEAGLEGIGEAGVGAGSDGGDLIFESGDLFFEGGGVFGFGEAVEHCTGVKEAEIGPCEIGKALVALLDDGAVEPVVLGKVLLQGLDVAAEGVVALREAGRRES